MRNEISVFKVFSSGRFDRPVVLMFDMCHLFRTCCCHQCAFWFYGKLV